MPYVMRVDDVVAVLQCGKSTLLKACRLGTFRPAPFERHPYRWLKADIERDIQQRNAAAQARVDRVVSRVQRAQRRQKRA